MYRWLQGDLLRSPKDIVVSRGQVLGLQIQFERTWQRPPTEKELQSLVDNWVREEVFYREGVAMGLDRDDPIVRRRIGQKVEFIIEGMTPAVPTAQQMQAWLDAHPDKYSIEPRFSFRQVYLDPSQRGDRLEADAAEALRLLQAGKTVDGDSTMLPASLESARRFDVERNFGTDFATGIESLQVGRWNGPVRSEFGLHLVELTALEPGRNATLDEARAAVERDLLHARTVEASESYYEELRKNYTVQMESAEGGAAKSAE
jgi:PPIC-type PPIASE domain